MGDKWSEKEKDSVFKRKTGIERPREIEKKAKIRKTEITMKAQNRQ